MIRPVTCVCLLMAAASGLYLYSTKHRTRLLDRQIEQTVQATTAVRERSGLLRAEWALLNDPSRLADLAARHLTLHQVMPAQFITLAELDHRLPATRTYPAPDAATPASPVSVPPAAVPIAQAAPPSTVQQAASQPAATPRPAAPQRLAAVAPAAPVAAPMPIAQSTPVPAARPPVPRIAVTEHEAREPAARAAMPLPPARESAREVAAREVGPREVAPREVAGREPAPALKPMITQAMATTAPRAAGSAGYAPGGSTLQRQATGYPQRMASAAAAEAAGRFRGGESVPGAVPVMVSALGAAHASLAPPVPVPVSATDASLSRLR